METTRLAPSPTGALHLGNARTFLVTWALARQRGWRVALRIDDLDGPRIKPHAAEQAIGDLRWLGLDWDGPPRIESEHRPEFAAALAQLARTGAIYPCRCTRSEILAASLSAPHGEEHELRYPGTCRPAEPTLVDPALLEDPQLSWRFRTPDITDSFVDQFTGPQSFNTQRIVGDLLVGTKGCLPSYQLAVVVDDAAQGVTQIVRGDDLLSSTPRQLRLHDELGLGPPPTYWHLPLVIGEDGRRLAKRHGDTRVSHYRELGVRPECVLGLLTEWCGHGAREEITAAEFCKWFAIEKLPREAIKFSAEDDRWLRSV
jgi:glutamyl-tRNA synthetase